MKMIVADENILAENIEKIRQDFKYTFDFSEDARNDEVDYYDCNIGEEFETEEYSSWYQVKYLEIADGSYIIVGYYGGGYSETYDLDDYSSIEIATMIFNDLGAPTEKIFVEVK